MATLEFPAIPAAATPLVSAEELGLATRNHGLPLECLRWSVTPLGLHYLLIHYDIQYMDVSTWSLTLGGNVANARTFTYDELLRRPAVTRASTMECAGNGRMALTPRAISQPWGVEAVGNAEWTGTPLGPILEEAGIGDSAVEIVFGGADRGVENNIEQRYERSLTIDEAMRDEVMLVYAINGQPLTPQHGYPLRLIVPGWYGMTNVKWLTDMTVVDEPFEGYQQTHAYRVRYEEHEPGEVLERIRPRALMIPPGVPDFLTRERLLEPGPTKLEGRAWSGFAPIERVEVSTDAGRTWTDAELGPQPERYAWVGWSTNWVAEPGEHGLSVRAYDAAGNVQPLEPEWNLGGYACNSVQHLSVTVKSA